jgi:predicted  nucleic acid-binding Zn-ribbon protein
MSYAVLLRELHRIHIQLGDLRERIEKGPRQVKAHEANVARTEAEATRIKNEQKSLKMAMDAKNLQLKSGESKMLDLKTKLNQSKSNREYQALKDQIAADQMSGSVLQDEILELEQKVEDSKKTVAAAEALLAKAKEEVAKVQQKVLNEQGSLEADFTRLEAQLIESEKGLPDDLRVTYQRMVRDKGADSMAVVEGENCGGCYQQLTPNTMSSLMMDKVILCQVCGRMLYLSEDRSIGGRASANSTGIKRGRK